MLIRDLTEADAKPTMTVDDKGVRTWYLNGKKHREDGPAVERGDHRAWFIDGKLHRDDGPAVEFPGGFRAWYLNGRRLIFNEWLEQTKSTLKKGDILRFLLLMIKQGNIKGAAECLDELGRQGFDYPEFAAIRKSISDGITESATEPKMIVDIIGRRRWYLNGQFHRTDGPAVEYPSGYRAWWVNGKKHRTDGPAIEDPDGNRLWFINGQHLTFADWLKKTKPTLKKADILRFLLLMIKQGNIKGAAKCLEELKRQGVDYPEFAAIERSINAGVKR